jgi:hypothetical protein
LSRADEGFWYQWTPINASSPAYADVADGVDLFESLDTPAGRAATRYLREQSLQDYPSTVTYVYMVGDQVDGYFSLASGSVTLTQRHRKSLRSGQRDYPVSPTQGASLVAWLARHRDGIVSGRKILVYALSIALQVARRQGTLAVVLDPFDDDTAEMWAGRYGFRRSQTRAGSDVRLWIPLHPKTG